MDLIIVDDDKIMKNIFDKILLGSGLDYEIYHDAHEGLDAIIAKKPRCVILDYNMPNLKGDEMIVISSQKCLFKYSNFIMVTGEKVDATAKMKFMTLGFQYIFNKSDLLKDGLYETVLELVEDKRQIA